MKIEQDLVVDSITIDDHIPYYSDAMGDKHAMPEHKRPVTYIGMCAPIGEHGPGIRIELVFPLEFGSQIMEKWRITLERVEDE